MKFTWRDIVWCAIIALILLALSKCHRNDTDKMKDKYFELEKQFNNNKANHEFNQQQLQNKLVIAKEAVQIANNELKVSEAKLSQSIATIKKLGITLKAAKELEPDSTFTLVSPEYMNICDSMWYTVEKSYEQLDVFKKKYDLLVFAKDTLLQRQTFINKETSQALTHCQQDYIKLQHLYSIQKPVNQLYIGAEILSGAYVIQNVGVALTLKTKTNKLWQISGGIQNDGHYYGRINGNILISFKR